MAEALQGWELMALCPQASSLGFIEPEGPEPPWSGGGGQPMLQILGAGQDPGLVAAQ